MQTPEARVIDDVVVSVVAEDQSGRFGIREGAEPIVSALIPGLLSYLKEDASEHWLAIGSGVLRSSRDDVLVSVRQAVQCSSLDQVREEVLAAASSARQSESAMQEAFRSMYHKLMSSLIEEERGG